MLTVTESRLDSTIPDSKICPSGYVCYKKDRNRNGGSCAVFVKSKWPSKRRMYLESDSVEMLCVEICPDKAKNTRQIFRTHPYLIMHTAYCKEKTIRLTTTLR